MTRQRAKTTSQILATTVTLAAVLIMLAPLRRGAAQDQPRQAGWSPLLNLGGTADTTAFQRLQSSGTRFAASARPLSRTPTQPVP